METLNDINEIETSNPFRFLDLPPEIRNEIYTHILVGTGVPSARGRFGPLPTRGWLAFGSVSRVKPPPDPNRLSVFLVNRQVHKEAVSIFYGLNTFSIEVFVGPQSIIGFPGDPNFQWVYGVEYAAPWEHFHYEFAVEDLTGRWVKRYKPPNNIFYDRYPETSARPSAAAELLQVSQDSPGKTIYPSKSYRPLIRKVNLTFRDFRDPSPNEIGGVEITSWTYSLLLPFLWRLRELLAENTTMEIEIERVEFSDSLFENMSESEKAEKLEARRTALKAGYLFTRGPWKSTFKLSDPLKSIHEDVFAECEKSSEFQEGALQKSMRELSVGLANSTAWGLREGILTMFYLSSQGQALQV
ncbi:hypothetical protein TWF481_008875 [Arthrobotrys musiformis]|uniref:Uncharacterized protein n=1 Tax=Arthrobotrys musiformis TaxID=47236 RepID=A0AAV9WAF5_9PEZI